MPYTPPTLRSPATSPPVSRRSSYQAGMSLGPPPPPSSRPALPRSASYLTRHRRTPSVKTSSLPTASEEHTPPGTADGEKESIHPNGSIRQSPPPVKDSSLIPPHAVISPPDSAQNSSDEEGSTKKTQRLEDLAKIQSALTKLELPSHENLIDSSEAKPRTVVNTHRRANTESSVFDLMASEPPSDDESEEDLKIKPPMVRKKSGELVRPALRPSSRRRPSSMPGTPTFSKAVHFDSHLEHVRHFLQVDRPLAVSAGSSPVENYDSDSEFPFDDERGGRSREPPFEWEIVLANFPTENAYRMSQPVRVERVFLSNDNKNLVGTVAVANISFHKSVVARFTLDYWRTTSEVVAEYNNDIRRRHDDGYDRFNFNIRLSDQANLEAKTMFFCVKYTVNGQEYWDNNGSMNYQVDFKKKAKPQNGKKGMQGAASRPLNSLPRSHHKRSEQPKPSATFDDFGDDFDSFDFGRNSKRDVQDYLGESSRIRLKGSQSAINLPTQRRNTPGGSQFSNRYDFGASLSAAINAANNVLGDRSGLPKRQPATATHAVQTDSPSSSPLVEPKPLNAAASPLAKDPSSPSLAQANKAMTYNELLDRFCFFGSNKSSPQLKDGSLSRSGQLDGTTDYMGSPTQSQTQSSESPSPVMVETRSTTSSSSTRSTSPAPMTGFANGSSPMYTYRGHGSFPFGEPPAATAIRG